mmetsp:Transcript_60073/g.152446  ORF Transcript_60073/g.152446 Transcript_60073/m.152446 type:complete len:213 (+) Transcript_60073:71-709(+)
MPQRIVGLVAVRDRITADEDVLQAVPIRRPTHHTKTAMPNGHLAWHLANVLADAGYGPVRIGRRHRFPGGFRRVCFSSLRLQLLDVHILGVAGRKPCGQLDGGLVAVDFLHQVSDGLNRHRVLSTNGERPGEKHELVSLLVVRGQLLELPDLPLVPPGLEARSLQGLFSPHVHDVPRGLVPLRVQAPNPHGDVAVVTRPLRQQQPGLRCPGK